MYIIQIFNNEQPLLIEWDLVNGRPVEGSPLRTPQEYEAYFKSKYAGNKAMLSKLKPFMTNLRNHGTNLMNRHSTADKVLAKSRTKDAEGKVIAFTPAILIERYLPAKKEDKAVSSTGEASEEKALDPIEALSNIAKRVKAKAAKDSAKKVTPKVQKKVEEPPTAKKETSGKE